MKELKKIMACIVVLLLIAIIAFWLVNMNMEQNRKARISNRLDRQYLWLSYTYCLNITASEKVLFVGKKIAVPEEKLDEIKLIEDVALYNAFNKDTPVSVDALKDEYYKFCDGMEKSELIESYRDNIESIKIRAAKAGVLEFAYDYELLIADYSKDNYGKRLDDITTEEMYEIAPIVAEKIYNEVISYEQN